MKAADVILGVVGGLCIYLLFAIADLESRVIQLESTPPDSSLVDFLDARTAPDTVSMWR